MTDAKMHEYAQLMNDVTLPRSEVAAVKRTLRGHTTDAWKKAKGGLATREAAESQNSDVRVGLRILDGGRRDHAENKAAPSRPSSSRHRIAAVAACFLLLTCGVLALGTAGLLPGSISPSGRAAAKENGGFVLKAYAEGTSVTGSANTVLAPSDLIDVMSGGWSTREAHGEDSGEPDGLLESTTSWTLDPSWIGDGVKAVQVSVEGEGLSLRLSERRDGDGDASQADADKQLVEYTTSAIDLVSGWGSGGQIDLEITVPVGDDLQKANEQAMHPEKQLGLSSDASTWNDAEQREVARLLDKAHAVFMHAAAQKLSEHPVTITATLQDGSTVSHTYRFTPVDDFEQLYYDYQQKTWGSGEHVETERPALFTITQVK